MQPNLQPSSRRNSHAEHQYLDLLRDIRLNGVDRSDRTGVGTRGLFGHQFRFDLTEGFPLLTTKRVFFKGVVAELLWMLSGDTNVETLRAQDVHIWDEWAGESGELGPVYGKQWRSWSAPDGRTIDQITVLIDGLKRNPYSRRHVVSAWNPAELEDMALPPCHCLFQFYFAPDANGRNRLSCQLYQRSADIFLGVPFNIASYALLTMMIAQVCDMEVGEFVHSFGDVHLYHNHFEQADEQLSREPREWPTVSLNPEVHDVFAFTLDDFHLQDYHPHPRISAPVAK